MSICFIQVLILYAHHFLLNYYLFLLTNRMHKLMNDNTNTRCTACSQRKILYTSLASNIARASGPLVHINVIGLRGPGYDP